MNGTGRPRIVVVGSPAHEGVMAGRAFEILGAAPVYIDSFTDEPPWVAFESKPDLVLVSLEWVAKHRLIAAEARRAGIGVVYLVDGVIEWSYVWNNLDYIRPNGTFLQPLLSHRLCVVGRHQARVFASWGLGAQIRLVGLPRLDGVPGQSRHPGDRPRVLILTAKTYGHDIAQKMMVRRGLSDLKAWFDANPAVEPQWRVDENLAFDLEIGPLASGPLEQVLAGVQATIAWPSTSLLESMRMGIPTAQVEYRPVPLYVETAWQIRCANHVPAVIHGLLYPSAAEMAYQSSCLEDELEPGDASSRLASVILEAAGTPGAPALPEPARGALDFRQVHSQLSVFASAPTIALQYELDAAWQSLERAWRRIHVVEEERDQLAHALSEQRARLGEAARRACEERERARHQRDILRRARRLVAAAERRGIGRVVVYGAGEFGAVLARACGRRGVEVVAVTDSDVDRWGALLAGHRVVPPTEALAHVADAVLAGSMSRAGEIADAVRALTASIPTLGAAAYTPAHTRKRHT